VSDASQIWTPAWSADGRWIAYDGTDAVSFIVPDMVDNVDYDVSVDSVWIGRVTYEHSQAWVRAILLVVLMATTAVAVVRTARRRRRATPASFET
jgi:hypothetical protein